MKPIKRLELAKQIKGIETKKEACIALRWKYVERIGSIGAIKVRDARIFIAAMKIGRATFIRLNT
jgi:hypothetical protein